MCLMEAFRELLYYSSEIMSILRESGNCLLSPKDGVRLLISLERLMRSKGSQGGQDVSNSCDII